jgi:hypothetical protein
MLDLTSDWVMELHARSAGFLFGAVALASANVIPKRVSSVRGLPMLRIAGGWLVLGAAGYSLSWLLLPLSHANTIAMLSMIVALALCAFHLTWHRFNVPTAPRSSG